MRLSRLGTVFCLIYLLPAIVCVAMALSSGDSKSRFVLLQLPIALQISALDAMGFRESLHGLSWPAAYLLLCVPVVAALYCIGLGLGLLFKRMSSW